MPLLQYRSYNPRSDSERLGDQSCVNYTVKLHQCLKITVAFSICSSETENGGEEKHKKAGKPFNEQLQPLNIDAELFQTRKKSPLVR